MRLVDVGGRLVELHIRRSKRVNGHRLYVRQGMPPELVVRPRASDAYIDDAIALHKTWLERQLANVAEPCLGLEPPARSPSSRGGARPTRGSC